MPLATETHLPLRAVVNESLRVVERLRTDRFGVVYRVEDEIKAGQTYSLRLFNRGLVNSRVFAALGEYAERLRNTLDEPDILADYIPIQLEDGRYALLAADHPGSVLDEVIHREAPLTPSFVVSTLLRIADVLIEAHDVGLVHGNLTPESLLVVDRNERGLAVKLLDFGIIPTIRKHSARALSIPAGASGFRGYDNYYAPELVTGREVETDERTEVFALGALCYHMLSGWIPFHEAAIEGDATVYLTADPRPLVMLNRELGIPRSLEETMLKAMELDPSRRHGSLAELIEVLQEIELDLSILPSPGSLDKAAPAPRRAQGTGAKNKRGSAAAKVKGRATDPIAGTRSTSQPAGEAKSLPNEEPDVPTPHGT